MCLGILSTVISSTSPRSNPKIWKLIFIFWRKTIFYFQFYGFLTSSRTNVMNESICHQENQYCCREKKIFLWRISTWYLVIQLFFHICFSLFLRTSFLHRCSVVCYVFFAIGFFLQCTYILSSKCVQKYLEIY